MTSDVRALISSGLALIPIPLGLKRPTCRGWNKRENVIATPADAHVLAGKNIGLAHAYCEPTPTCAIDIDNYKLARLWLAERGADLKALLFASDAVVIWSGKRFSIKLLYRLPPTVAPIATATVKATDGSMVLEFRCATRTGLTVQDVLPPSVHPGGSRYDWVGAGSPLAMPTIPPPLLTIWLAHLSGRSPDASRCDVARIPTLVESPRNVARVCELLSAIDADCSYETYRNVIWAIEALGWRCAEGLQRGWSMTAPDRFDEVTLDNLRRSYRPGGGRIGFGTLVYEARQAKAEKANGVAV